MSHIIHNQAGQLASQRQRISSLQQSLQDDLTAALGKIKDQEAEIKSLKK